MAVSVGKKIDELEAIAQSLGVEVIGSGKDGKKKKEDYIYPLRKYNLIQRYGSIDKVPEHLNLILQLKSPMLAGRIDSFKPDQQEEVWGSSEWMFEHKLNGVRCIVVNSGDGILHLYSRHNGTNDFLPIEMTENVMLPAGFDGSKISKSFIIDTEITSDNPQICTIVGNDVGVETATQLQAVTAILGSLPEKAIQIQRNNNLSLVFNIFDCLYYDGQWIMNETLQDRRMIMEGIIYELERLHFNARRVPSTVKDKKRFVQNLLNLGFEGAVAKRVSGIYIPDTTRNFKGWVKIKRSLKSSLASQEFDVDAALNGMGGLDFGDDNPFTFGDSIDVFVSGFEPGSKGSSFEKLVGSVTVSAYVKRFDGSLEETELGKFSGITLEERQNMTMLIDGKPVLKPEYYQRVVEIDAQQITAHGRFQHCVFKRWRFDKTYDQCIISEEFLIRNLV